MAQLRTAKYDNVNLLRAIAALAVVVYHVIEHGQWTTFPSEGPLKYLRIGWIGVDLFFAISGFVIAYSALLLYRKEPGEFAGKYWRRRLSRIVPLYMLTLVLWIAFAAPGFFSQPARGWAWQLFTHLAFIHSFWPDTHGALDGPNWSLAVEMQFYLAVALLIRWIDRTPGWRIWLYAILIAWAWRACMLMLYGNGDAYILFVKTTQLPGMLDEFGAGIFLAKWVLDGRHPMPMKGLLPVLGAAVTGYFAMQLFWPRATFWNNGYMVVFRHTALSVRRWNRSAACASWVMIASVCELPKRAIWARAESTPSTTAIESVGPSHSVLKSRSVAAGRPGTTDCARASARKSQPSAARSATIAGSREEAMPASMSSVSVAPHTPVRRILPLTTMALAMARSALRST